MRVNNLNLDGMLQVAKTAPWRLVAMAATLTRGRLALKDYVARNATFDPAALPYRADLIDHIARERAAGRPIHAELRRLLGQAPATPRHA